MYYRQNRTDGITNLANALTGMGNPNYDPSMHSYAAPSGNGLSPQQASLWYRSSKIIRRLVDKIPNQMVQNGFTITLSDGKPEQVEEIMRLLNNLPGRTLTRRLRGWKKLFSEAQKKANLTGNAAIILGVEDNASSMSEPVNDRHIRGISNTLLLDRSYVWRDPSDFDYYHFSNMPYQMRSGMRIGSKIHYSRVLWFRGDEVVDDLNSLTNSGMDDSILNGFLEIFVDMRTGIKGAGRMLVDWDIFVHKIDGLLEKMSGPDASNQESKMLQRMQVNQISKSIWRGMFIDKEMEDISHSTRSAGGYADLIDKLSEWLKAHTDLTVAELFNQQPTGFDTGEVQNEIANQRTKEYQVDKFEENLQTLINYLLLSKYKEIPSYTIQYLPLFPPTPEQQAKLELDRAAIDSQNINNGLYTGEEAVKSHYSTAEYNPNITIDWEARDKAKKAEEEAQKAAIDQSSEGVPEEAPTEQENTDAADIRLDAKDRYAHINFRPPRPVRRAAQIGLELRKKFKRGGLTTRESGEQGIGSGQARAVSLQRGQAQDPDTIKRMVGYFSRHQGDKRAGWDNPEDPSNGYIAWLLWGGDDGWKWAKSIVQQMESADLKAEKARRQDTITPEMLADCHNWFS